LSARRPGWSPAAQRAGGRRVALTRRSTSSRRIGKDGAEKEGFAELSYALRSAWMSVTIYGCVMRGVLEEKPSRIVEVSSPTSGPELMPARSSAGAGLTQYAICARLVNLAVPA
jgi:hypothetical protein